MLFYACLNEETTYPIRIMSRLLRARGIARDLDEPTGQLKLYWYIGCPLVLMLATWGKLRPLLFLHHSVLVDEY
jgi:hypothetical protein